MPPTDATRCRRAKSTTFMKWAGEMHVTGPVLSNVVYSRLSVPMNVSVASVVDTVLPITRTLLISSPSPPSSVASNRFTSLWNQTRSASTPPSRPTDASRLAMLLWRSTRWSAASSLSPSSFQPSWSCCCSRASCCCWSSTSMWSSSARGGGSVGMSMSRPVMVVKRNSCQKREELSLSCGGVRTISVVSACASATPTLATSLNNQSM
mmetsp:Transcript_42672/g.121057  ORF Transcript_42672/g.121057 Transcript_42672/m.121057 type:complete len:208 (-) Transcript_42672:451-1074(-)